jgi:riboflavin transporter FmnP
VIELKTKQIVYSGLLIACSVLLPQLFHLVGGPGLGTTLLPMHIPVLIAGFILGPITGLIIGAISPICSFLYTGGTMPSIPMLYLMIVELGTYGLFTGLVFKRFKLNVYVSLIIAMIAGRITRGLAFVISINLLGIALPPAMGISVAIIQGIPGITLQLLIVPPTIYLLCKLPYTKNLMTQ